MNAISKFEVDKAKRTRVVFVIIGACALLVLGLVYAWSIFAIPLGEVFNWDYSSLYNVFAISMTAFCLGALGGAQISKRTSIKFALFTAALMQALGFILTASFASTGIWALYICYGVVAGFGCGIGYNTIISTINLWFTDRVGLSSGILMMGFGLGSLVLGSFVSNAIASFGWSSTFIAIGLVSACILIVLAFVLRMPPDNIEELVGRGTKRKRTTIVELSTKPIYKTPEFYAFFLWVGLLVSASFTLTGNSKVGAVDLGIDPGFATLLVGFVSLSNGLARVISGMVFDKMSIRAAMLMITAFAFVGIGLLALSFWLALPELYIAAAIITGFVGGGGPVMASSFARERYGPKDYPRNLATVNLSIIFSSLLSSLVVAIGRPLGGDLAVYSILFVLVILGFGVSLIFYSLYFKKSEAP